MTLMLQDRINPRSKVPLYHQLHEILRNKILRADWQPGDTFPPESELVKRYQLSRTTVRQVLGMLEEEGLVYKQKGRGTYVAQPTLEQGLTHIISFTQDMQLRGFEAGSEILFSDLIPAPEDIAAKLQVDAEEELVLLSRLRLANGEPLSIEESHLVHRYCPGVLKYDYTSTSLRAVMKREYGIRWAYAKQVIRAIAAPDKLAQLLSVESASPLLYLERTSYSQQDVLVEFLRVYYRADRYSLYSDLRG